MKILHVLYQSLPDTMGSSIRTRDIFGALKNSGVDLCAVTSPFQRPYIDGKDVEVIDGVRVHRSYSGDEALGVSQKYQGFFRRLKKISYIYKFYRRIIEVLISEKPDLVHAHATFFCFFAAYFANKKRVPLIYEVRSLWEDMGEKGAFKRLQSIAISKLEILAIRRADFVVTINESLRREVFERSGVDSFVIPNAIGSNLVNLSPEYNFRRPLRFGYIGSLNIYEGLHLALEAVVRLNKEGFPIDFCVFGGGMAKERLLEFERALPDRITLFGAFGHDEVASIYDNLDVIVLPRESTFITERVTPLKPLEAAAFGKKIILSDIRGHRELMRDCPGLKYFKSGDVSDMMRAFRDVYAMSDADLFRDASEAGSYVRANFSWDKNGFALKRIYSGVIDGLNFSQVTESLNG